MIDELSNLWSKNIYILTVIFQSLSEENEICGICIFIIRFYIKAWFFCSLAARATNSDLNFIKSFKLYERNDQITSMGALNKISNHHGTWQKKRQP